MIAWDNRLVTTILQKKDDCVNGDKANIINRLYFKLAKNKEREKPIIILGHERSGTSWFARCFNFADNVIYIHEPSNPNTSYIGDWSIWYKYLNTKSDDKSLRNIYENASRAINIRNFYPSEMLALSYKKNMRVVIKDVASLQLINWLKVNIDSEIIAMVRHPVPVINSNIKMAKDKYANWLKSYIDNNEMSSKFIDPFINISSINFNDSISCAAIIWAIRHKILQNTIKNYKDINIIKYEKLCTDTEQIFKHFTNKYNINLSKSALYCINKTTNNDDGKFYGFFRKSSTMPDKWKNETPVDVIEKIYKIMHKFEFPIYNNEKDWDIIEPKSKLQSPVH